MLWIPNAWAVTELLDMKGEVQKDELVERHDPIPMKDNDSRPLESSACFHILASRCEG